MSTPPDLDDVDAACIRAADLVEAGKLQEGAEIFRELCTRESVAESIRAVMAVNLATVYDKMGYADIAEQTHEYACSIVQYPYLFAEESRASFLLKIGRSRDAVAILELLLSLPRLPADASQRIASTLQSIPR